VILRGLAVLDRRSQTTRELLRWRAAITAELGGGDRLTELQRTRIDTASRTKVLLDHIDAQLLEHQSLFASKGRLRKEVRGLLQLRQSMADAFDRVLRELGIRATRDAAILPSLDDLVRGDPA